MIFLDINKTNGMMKDIEIVNTNNDRVSKIPEDKFVIFANMLVNKSIVPKKNMNILLLFLPNTFLKHSDDKLRNIDSFINIAQVHSPRNKASRFSNLLIFATLVDVYIGNSLICESSPSTPVTKNIIDEVRIKTETFQKMIPCFKFPFDIGISIVIAGIHDIREIMNKIPLLNESYPSRKNGLKLVISITLDREIPISMSKNTVKNNIIEPERDIASIPFDAA